MFEPFYSFHRDQLLVKDLVPKSVKLNPSDWSFTRADLQAAVLSRANRTKAIIVNSPSNPSGKVFSREQLQIIADVCLEFNLLAISDEVYEFMTYDGREHISLATLPEMWSRTITISSFGKLLSCTGWRVGYAIGL